MAPLGNALGRARQKLSNIKERRARKKFEKQLQKSKKKKRRQEKKENLKQKLRNKTATTRIEAKAIAKEAKDTDTARKLSSAADTTKQAAKKADDLADNLEPPEDDEMFGRDDDAGLFGDPLQPADDVDDIIVGPEDDDRDRGQESDGMDDLLL